jgi:cytochrome c oxidase assembly protein subunit 15
MKTYDRGIVYWLFTGCVLVWAMVIVGGITRLTHSGLSMVTWSFVNKFPPHTNEEWQRTFEDYKKTPEFKQINSYFSIEDYKSIYWWEYIHREIGNMIGVVFIIPFFYFLWKKRISRPLMMKLLGILAIGALQGLLGWYMVSSGLVNEPHVSHYRLAAHLMTALLSFGFTFWVALDLIYPRQTIEPRFKSIRIWSVVLLCFVSLQIMYGAFTSGLHAGQFDPTWPKMGDNWVAPEVTNALSPVWKNFLDGVAGVQFIHRYNAYVVTLLVLLVWFKARKQQLLPTQRHGVNVLLGMVFVQFLLGVFTLIYSVPVVLGVLHQTGAFLLLASTLFVIHQWNAQPEPAKALS